MEHDKSGKNRIRCHGTRINISDDLKVKMRSAAWSRNMIRDKIKRFRKTYQSWTYLQIDREKGLRRCPQCNNRHIMQDEYNFCPHCGVFIITHL